MRILYSLDRLIDRSKGYLALHSYTLWMQSQEVVPSLPLKARYTPDPFILPVIPEEVRPDHSKCSWRISLSLSHTQKKKKKKKYEPLSAPPDGVAVSFLSWLGGN